MNSNKYLLIFLSFFILSNCKNNSNKYIGSIEIINDNAYRFISSSSKVEILASGFSWSEGPVWSSKLNGVIFTDVPENKAYLWTEKNGLEIFLDPSGKTGYPKNSANGGANGLIINSEGELILCQHGDRRLAKLKDWPSKNPEFETIVDNYNGNILNSPNDLAISKDGSIFFTDPPYGLANQDLDSLKEINFNGVYKFKDNKLKLLINNLSRPNGIALSNDENFLYVANSDKNIPIINVYEISNDTLINEKVFFDGSKLTKTNKGLFDGLKIHSSGTIFATGPGGVLIIDNTGKHLGTINPGSRVANCAFDKKEDFLYMTSDNNLTRIKINYDPLSY
tara:strand:- start:2910 stop:3920 length:1011 start_codon:yes stop_codon:yes gene_type:complete